MQRGRRRVLKRVLELGITLIDTADAYGPEVNERLIAETLHPYPEEIVIATKGGLTRPRRESWDRNGRPEHLRTACEAQPAPLEVAAHRPLSAARTRSARAARGFGWHAR